MVACISPEVISMELGEKQTKNLGRILQRSNICPNILPNGSFKCNKSNCGTCDYIQETNVVHFNSEEGLTNFKLFKHFNCRSQNVIYKITCKGCLQYYIGETVHLQHRVSNHKCQIRNPDRVQKVHRHIVRCTNDFEFPFTIVPFYFVTQGTLVARLTVEDYFRRKFDPWLNG